MTVSENVSETKKRRASVAKKPITPRKKVGPDVKGFATWLEGLETGVTPTIHINGPDHPMAILTLDFGTPLEPIPKFENEQVAELHDWLKKLTRDIINRDDTRISVLTDNSNGVWWTSTN